MEQIAFEGWKPFFRSTRPRPKRSDRAIKRRVAEEMCRLLIKRIPDLRHESFEEMCDDLEAAICYETSGYKIGRELESLGWDVDDEIVEVVTLNEAKGPSPFIATSASVVKGAVPRGRRGRQNLVARSEDLTLSPWVDISGGLNFAVSASLDPYGGAVTRLYNATKNGFRAQYVPYKAQGVQYTFAALVKYVAGSGYVMFRHSGTWTVFDVKNGGFGSSSNDTFSTRVISRGITLISDGWYLCWYTYLAPGPTSVYVGICPSTSTGGATTNDWDILIGRVELTEGNYGVPYTKTVETDTDEGAPRSLGT